MILVDANILIYAVNQAQPEHIRARKWLDDQLNGTAAVGLPWTSLLAFVRITSDRRVFPKTPSVADNWRRVELWLDCPAVWIPMPTERHREILGEFLRTEAPQANLVNDAHLAALAIEHGLTLCTTDRDFARFSGLRWQNPLA